MNILVAYLYLLQPLFLQLGKASPGSSTYTYTFCKHVQPTTSTTKLRALCRILVPIQPPTEPRHLAATRQKAHWLITHAIPSDNFQPATQ